MSDAPQSTPSLPNDPLWPRAGGWPAFDSMAEGERAALTLVGVPAWRTSLSATGAHATPDAIRSALRRYSPTLVAARDHAGQTFDSLRIVDAGNCVEPDWEEGEARVRELVSPIAARTDLVVALGGDNSLTYSVATAVWQEQIATAGLVTLDAHFDLRDGISNGSPVRRLLADGLDGRRVVQIGIADFVNSNEYAQRAQDAGITVIHRDELHRRPIADVMAEALAIAGAAGGPIHVDLDVDVCDRAIAPGCPASVPGGIAAHELRTAARIAGAHPQVTSLDLAEVDATADTADQRTVRLAALCVLEAAAGLLTRSSVSN